jgi:two-component system, chemotaxis family, chemotaxis protein CheY
MRTLIVEDDAVSRFLLSDILGPHGTCHVAVDGQEAVEAVATALDEGRPYDLICLDIKMPNMNGLEALAEIRAIEADRGLLLGDGARIIMTTCVEDAKSIMDAFNKQCEAYLIKPITEEKLLLQLRQFELIPD